MIARNVPEPTAVRNSTIFIDTIVVNVICCESSSVGPGQSVKTGIARKPSNVESVSFRLAVHNEPAVFSPEPLLRGGLLQVESQLVAVFLGQLMQQVVSDPQVTAAVVEAHSELVP